MKNRIIVALVLLLVLPGMAFAIDVATSGTARLDIVSRTSFGIDLDNPYRFGLSNELTQFDLVFGLAPWQQLSNRPATDQAVGFIQVTLFHLNLIQTAPDREADREPPGDTVTRPPPGVGGPGYNPPGPIWTNRFQTGSFLAGIAWGPWLLQLNAGGNEPFTAPWNKGMEFINDGFRVSWAYLDSMVDVRRVLSITGIPVITRRGEENLQGDGQTGPHGTMQQFGFDTMGNISDRFGMNLDAQMIALMYNAESFGLNFKLGTQFAFQDSRITRDNRNGLAFGIDSVFNPGFLPGMRIFASMAGTNNWGAAAHSVDVLHGGTRIGYTIQLHEEISVEPWAGFDIGTRISRNGDMEIPGYEFSIGATMRWPGQGGWLTDYILNSDGRVFPGMSIGYMIFEDRERDTGLVHSLRFTLHEPRGDFGLFYGLGSQIVVDIIDITGITTAPHPPAWGADPIGGFCVLVTAYFDWEFRNLGRMPGTLRPWTILFYDNLPSASDGNGRINDFKIDLGLNIENAIANTTLGVVWNTGSLIQNSSVGFLRLIAEIRL